MEYRTKRISDYLDDPPGTWKYLMSEKHSDYITACDSIEQVKFNRAYGWKNLRRKYYVTKISVWPHRRFKKENYIWSAKRLSNIITGKSGGTKEEVDKLTQYLLKHTF